VPEWKRIEGNADTNDKVKYQGGKNKSSNEHSVIIYNMKIAY